ncbi:MAG TPA: winged helix-turn-helix domain-containing protein [Pyrinomonadaceae bacterium]|nr:winged helix-turn-helix domain-containing protein [Pyrinomonadaceae bacterium]HMP65687.1 winged helix-turn-helix domain-containing protein [Pyrinomonadaceae bacterium]
MEQLNGKNLIEFGDIEIDVEKKVLRRNDEVVPLPLKAVELLTILAQNTGDVVSKEELMESVWTDAFVEDSVLTQNIYILRKTLKANGSKAAIKNVPRRGYIFEPHDPVRASGDVRPDLGRGVSAADPQIATQPPPQDKFISAKYRADQQSPRRFLMGAAVIAILFAAGFGGYRYLNGKQNSEVSSATPLRLRPVSQPSSLKRIAILQFSGSEPAFATSFSSDLSIRLGSINKFEVLASERVSEYLKKEAEIKADMFLLGELETSSGRFAADVRLIDAKTDSVIWSDNFEYNNVIQLLDAIANGASRSIVDRMTDVERGRVAKRLPTNLAAYQHYQRGIATWRVRNGRPELLRKAIELDQSFARAYAAVAGMMAMGSDAQVSEGETAESLLAKAFDLDDALPDAYAVQGFIRIFHHRDWDGAEKSLRNALELDGNNVNARHWLAVFYSIHRRLDEAKAELRLALELDPTNPTLLADLGQLHYFAGDDATALELCNKALEIEPAHSMARGYIAVINEPKTDDRESLLAEAETAMAADSFTLPYLNVDPKFDPVRGDARFREILRKMGL